MMVDEGMCVAVIIRYELVAQCFVQYTAALLYREISTTTLFIFSF